MPKALVIGAIVAVLVLVLMMSWLSRRSLEQSDEPAENVAAATTPAAQQPATPPPPAAAAQGPVVLTATGPAWIQVTDQGKSVFEAELQAGQSYTVPPNLTAPMLKAGKPESLRVTVGPAVAAPIGPPGKVTTVSLLPSDLLKAGAPAPAAAAAPAAPTPRPRARRGPSPEPAAPPAESQPATNTGM